ncbi:MAG: tryptophan--tRNA ligase [Patescibacteria group bacterium]
MAATKRTLLSGIQPSGQSHIGNYFGAMRQFVSMQKEHDCFFMIVDYHALNTIQNPKVMRENILNLAADYLAVGLDPKKSVIFKQSDVSEHTELAWIFDTITTVPFLERAHAYKDALANKKSDISVGLFNYPMLMAADILLYDTDVVPVGQDQKQHVEITRDTAEKFNRIYGETFKLPEAKILSDVAVVPGIDGRKMSKSYGNTIPLFAEDAEIEKLVMKIETDSEGPALKARETVLLGELHASAARGQPSSPVGLTSYHPANVYLIHRLFKSEGELKELYEENVGKYESLKKVLIEDIKAVIKPLREKRSAVVNDISAVYEVLKEGGERAKEKASAKMRVVREKVGVKLY